MEIWPPRVCQVHIHTSARNGCGCVGGVGDRGGRVCGWEGWGCGLEGWEGAGMMRERGG